MAAVTRRARGFTMIELMAVLAILAVLAWIALPLAELARERERERELQRALWQIRDAIDAYKKAYDARSAVHGPAGDGASGYPPNLLALVQGVPDARDGAGPAYGAGLAHYLRRLPRDPFAPPELPPEQTWGLRAYASPAEAPAAGADVYDVYSRAPGAGLNGVPFKAW